VDKTYFFISDLHLGFGSPETEKRKETLLIKFLDYAKTNADELIILGDLFDYWFEYRRVIQKDFFRVLRSIQELVDSGVEVHYIIGNHDFLHKNFFSDEIGVKLYFNPVEMTLNGKKFFLGHGDGLVDNDTGYKILKKLLRNSFVQWLFTLIHPDFGIWLASKTSRTSRNYTGKKHYGIIDTLFETAKEKLNDGFDYVMFGHSHKKMFEKFNDGNYINLGSWLDEPCYGKFNNNEFEIINWE